MKLIDTTPTGYEPHIAERKASELQSADGEWTYNARHGDGPFSVIDVFDENGEFVETYGEQR